jgi:DnaJ-class molecular chaperone
MKEKSAYDQSREMLAAAYKSLSEQKQEHAQTCHTCNGSGVVQVGNSPLLSICPTCRGTCAVIVMR